MSANAIRSFERTEEALVRDYLTALDEGHVLDALNTFSMDASMRDAAGRERRGIREIAAAFARHERPVRVEIEELTREGDAVAVRVRMRFPESRSPKTFRSLFRIRRNRIQSVVVDRLPVRRSRSHQSGTDAHSTWIPSSRGEIHEKSVPPPNL
jgi:ketosteroid isomerase-like protein